MEMVKIYHPELDVTETVNVGLAGVLKESGWEVPDGVAQMDDPVEEIQEADSIPRSEAMPTVTLPKSKSESKKAKESD